MADVGLWIDWSGAGFGETAYDDLTSYVIRATTVGGATPEITGASQAGSATFVVRNPDGLFDPDNASSPLYGLLRDGPRVWWGANTDGTLEAGRTVRGRWAGRIVEISPIPVAGAGDSTPTAEIICEDPLAWYSRVPVSLSEDHSPANPTSQTSVTFAQPSNGYTMVAYEIVPAPGQTPSVLGIGDFNGGAAPAGSGMVLTGGSATTTGTVTSGWTPSTWDGTLVPSAPSSIYSYAATNTTLGGTLPRPYDLTVYNSRFIWVAYGPATVRQSAYATASAGEGILMTFPDYSGSIPSGYVELAMPLQPQTGSWLVIVQSAEFAYTPGYVGGLGALPVGWVLDHTIGVFWGGYTWGVDTYISHYPVPA